MESSKQSSLQGSCQLLPPPGQAGRKATPFGQWLRLLTLSRFGLEKHALLNPILGTGVSVATIGPPGRRCFENNAFALS